MNISIRRLAAAVFAAALSAPALAQQARTTATAPDGTPTTVRFAPGTTKGRDARQLFTDYLPLPAGSEMVPMKTGKGGKGIVTQRFAQWYGGHRVEHGAYTVVSRGGEAVFMHGRVFNQVAGTSAPTIAEADALQGALAAVPAQQYRWQVDGLNERLRQQTGKADTTYYPTGSLVWIQDFSNDVRSADLHLAWRFDIFAEQPMAHKVVYVDAANGKILFTNNLIHHVAVTGTSLYSGVVNMQGKLTGGTYRLEDNTRGGGVFTLNYNNSTSQASAVQVTSSTGVFAQDPAVDAHWGAENVYDYWMQEHGRNSFDDQGTALYSYVHYSTDYDNAFWDGGAMNYGDGNFLSALTSLDVCAHEIGHGVCQETAELIYEAESGALNEGFSDIWAANIEQWADPNEVDAMAKDPWAIGEELSSPPMRIMSNPNLVGNPDTYEGNYYISTSGNCDGDNDQCGVHTNSNVLNYWYYLLVEGSGGIKTNDHGDIYFVSGIGFEDGAMIAYLAEQSMSPSDGFAEAREATTAAATALFGACSPQEEATTRAWYGVGVGPDYPPCAPTIAFPANDTSVSEWAPGDECGTSRLVSLPVLMQGPAPTGGDAVMTATVTGGTAVKGVDYVMNDTVATFPAGSTAPQYITLTVFDNGAVTSTGKTINLSMSLDNNGSNAATSTTLQTMSVILKSDDRRPDTGTTQQIIVGTDDGTESNYSSAFFGSAARARSQFIIPAATLLAEGVQPGRPVTALSFNVTEKNSTIPYSGYTLSMGHTTASGFSGAFLNAGTQVYNGNVTTALGWNVLTLQTPFVWNGTDNVVLQACFANADDNAGNDRVQGENMGTPNLTAYASSDATGDGCSMAWTNNTSPARPLIRFTQPLAPTPVETTVGDAHSWKITNGQEVYFYSSADSEVIAGITAATQPLGCVQTTLTHAGAGFVPATFGAFNRSIKEATITPEMNADSTNYTVYLYFTTAELDGKVPATLRMVRTTAATDADIDSTNTTIVTPLLLKSMAWTRFRGIFKGFGRYFLIDNTGSTGIPAAAANAGTLAVASNPFSDAIRIRASLARSADATVRLTDITGKTVLQTGLSMAAGQQYYTIPVSQLALPAGTYLLQVVTGEGVLQEKVVKQ